MKQKLSLTLLVAVFMSATVFSQIRITEVMSNSGTNGTDDWFELTNLGNTAVDISGWKMDDNSYDFTKSVALNGVTSIPAGKSVIFIETATPETTIPAFKAFWGGIDAVAVGSYTGSGIGLGSNGDGVIVFDADGVEIQRVSFGTATAGSSFYWTYNTAGDVVESGVSAVGTINGSISNQVTKTSADALGNIASPGNAAYFTSAVVATSLIRITEVMSNGGTPDWFELTNLGNAPADITGWKMDDNSFSYAASVALNGVTSIPAGKSVIFIETATPETAIPAFKTFWGGIDAVTVGSYTGSGIGLGSNGDGVIVFDADGVEIQRVSFGTATAGSSFYWTYNTAGDVVESALISTVGTINGTISNQVTITSADVLANVASPGSAVMFPVSSVIATPNVKNWSLVGNILYFDTLPSSSIEVYSLTGAKLLSLNPSREIELKLNQGVYIVRIDGQVTKVLLK